jgi:general secretion pathway protein G
MELRRRASERGFTLIEVLIVTVVLSIVASIALVSLFGALDRSKQRATMADMRIISRAIEAYIVDNNVPPDDAGGLAALTTALIPYQTNVLPVADHWRNDYVYNSDVTGQYTLESFGKDGLPGGDISVASRADYTLDIVLVNGTFVAAPE